MRSVKGYYAIAIVEFGVLQDTPKQCSLDNPRDCLTYCYVLDDGKGSPYFGMILWYSYILTFFCRVA